MMPLIKIFEKITKNKEKHVIAAQYLSNKELTKNVSSLFAPCAIEASQFVEYNF